jgi:LmbE family N-acetylglucosaminyl deacetylase
LTIRKLNLCRFLMSKILVIAPHMDDEVLGVGGTICKHVAGGDLVRVLFIGNRVYAHKLDSEILEREEAHALAAKEILAYQEVEFARLPDEQLGAHFVEVLDTIERAVGLFEPETVYVNHGGDPHQDHKTVFNATAIACRSISNAARSVTRLLCYEVPSSTDQSSPVVEPIFRPNHFVNIDSYLVEKLRAMRAYDTEQRTFPHPRSERGLKAQARSRGVSCYMEAAEAFMVLRQEWR